MKIQMQVALLFTFITGMIILILSVTVYYLSSRYAFNDFMKRLELRAVVAAKLHFDKDQTSAGAYSELRRQYLEVLPREKEYIFRYDSIRHKLDPRSELDLPLSFFEEVIRSRGKTVFRQVKQVQYAGILHYHDGDRWLVIKSAVNEYGTEVINNLQKVLIGAFIISVTLVFTTGIFFSKTTFEPVRKIMAQVRDISAHNLHLRLEAKKGRDEISELSNTFNNMLDRLQASFETQNNFVSNASHELRTPLTAIIGEAELALSRSRSEEEYRQSLQVITREAEKLRLLTGHLLTLAQTGFDGRKQSWEILRADELLWDTKHAVEEIEPGSRLLLQLDKLPEDERALCIMGNIYLLRQAISNILLNACKYSDHREVLVSLKTSADHVHILVTDKGIGIPAAEMRYIFDPFFRASNTLRYEGHGVGLPLARAIIRLHGGTLGVQSQEGTGTTVHVTIPTIQTSS